MCLKMINTVKCTIKKQERNFIEIYFDEKMKFDMQTGELSPEIGERILFYKGYAKNGFFHGDGIVEFDSGKKYEGLFMKGIFKKGTYTDKNGTQYMGEFVRGDLQNGKFLINKFGNISSEIYFLGIKTNFLFLKNKLYKICNKKKSNYTPLYTFEMKIKKD